jgi:uncharacterized LabA/DUF88 family protein
MSERYRHEICFTGPEDATALIEAAERAGFEVESASTEVDKNKEELTVQRDEARHDLASLRTRLADRRGEPSD